MVSIIIPTLNRAEHLKGVLRSIVGLRSSSEYEVILIDNGSTDATKYVCEEFQKLIPNFIYHYEPFPGLLTGRHKGAELAKGKILSFLDDDVELSPKWLEGVVSGFRDANVHLLTGPCLPKYESYPPVWLESFWAYGYRGKYCGWLSLMDLGGEKVFVDANFVWGLNFSIRKQTLIELGGFHPDCISSALQHFQGDGETGLTMKANEKGYSALYSPEALVYHLVPEERMTQKYFEKRAFYQGVCDSFTIIRKTYFRDKNKNVSINAGQTSIFNRMKFYFKYSFQKPKNIEGNGNGMKEILDLKYKEGYDFHQKAFYEVHNVKSWVLKENYWDYKLPKDDRVL